MRPLARSRADHLAALKQNVNRELNWICRGSPEPVLSAPNLSLLLFTFTSDVMWPKAAGNRDGDFAESGLCWELAHVRLGDACAIAGWRATFLPYAAHGVTPDRPRVIGPDFFLKVRAWGGAGLRARVRLDRETRAVQRPTEKRAAQICTRPARIPSVLPPPLARPGP